MGIGVLDIWEEVIGDHLGGQGKNGDYHLRGHREGAGGWLD